MTFLELLVLILIALLGIVFVGGVVFMLYFLLPLIMGPYRLVMGFAVLVVSSHILSRLYLMFIRVL